MKFWSLLLRLFSMLAILSFLAAPMASAAAMMAMESVAAMDGMADDMPCCPQQKPSLPDCQKSCPLANLCLAKCFANTPTLGASARVAFLPVAVLVPWDDAARDRLGDPPPPRPPRT